MNLKPEIFHVQPLESQILGSDNVKEENKIKKYV